MMKNQKLDAWLHAQPILRRLATRDWSFVGVDREREFVLLGAPILAIILVVGSVPGYALTPSPERGGFTTVEEAPDSFASTFDAQETTQQAEEAVMDPIAEAIELWGEPDLAAILSEEYPGAEWTLNGNTYESLVWLGPGPKPTEETLLRLWNRVGQILAERRVAAEEAAVEKAAAQQAQQAARAADPTRQELCRALDYRALQGSIDYTKILAIHYPGAQWTLNGDAYSGLTWIGPGDKPSKATLDSLWDGVAFGLCLQRPLSELTARAGTSETEEIVDGELRPKGYSDGTFQPTLATCGQLPQVANSNGGSPVGSIEIYKDPTGGQNFEQLYGMGLGDLGCRIAQAHGWFGGKYSMGLGLNDDRTLMWYSDQIDAGIVRGVLEGMGAFRSE
jgi:hypothetical protein